jgi:hypothetical protein
MKPRPERMILFGPILSQNHPVNGAIIPNCRLRIPEAPDVTALEKPSPALKGLKMAENPRR